MSESLCGFGNVISGSLHLPETKGIAIIVFPPECKSRRFCQKLCVCVCQVEIENVTRPSRNQFESVPLNDVCVFSNRFFRLSVAGVCWINMDDGRALKRSVGLARFSFFFFIRTAIALFARLHPHDDGCLFFFSQFTASTDSFRRRQAGTQKTKSMPLLRRQTTLLRGPFSVLWAKLLWVWGGLKSLGGKNKRRTL